MAPEKPRLALLLALLGLVQGCASSGWDGRVERWGTLRGVLREGDVGGKVALHDAAGRPGTVGVGALESLAGEITLVDGTAWISRGSDGGVVTSSGPQAEGSAAFLALARVERWREIPLAGSMDLAELEGLLGSLAAEPPLSAWETWPFLVDARLEGLEAHVLAGGCPFAEDERLRGEPSRFTRAGGRATLVGFFTGLPAGVITHHGSRTHVHALVPEPEAVSGHLDGVRLAAGSVLRVPR